MALAGALRVLLLMTASGPRGESMLPRKRAKLAARMQIGSHVVVTVSARRIIS